MQEKIETILKEIHITFSKCSVCKEAPDEIIVNKRIMFELLEKLNETVYEMMERYEVTVQGKDRAEREMKRKGEGIILDATQKAEDVYAASVLYTEDALGKLEKMMDQAKQRFDEMCNIFSFSLDGEKNLIKENKIELAGQLDELIETKKYLKIIEDQNKLDEKLHKKTIKETGKNTISAVAYHKKIHNVNTDGMNTSGINTSGINESNVNTWPIDKNHKSISQMDTSKIDGSKIDTSKIDGSKIDSSWVGNSPTDVIHADIGDEEMGMSRIPQAIIQVDLDAEYFKWKNAEQIEIKSTPKKSRKSFFGKK